MKRKLITLFCVLVLVLAFGAGQAFADDYTYTVTIYPGLHGHFTNGQDCWTETFKKGENCSINLSKIFVLDDDTYYPRGIRLSGHDNNEQTGYMTATFPVTEDLSYTVAYGIKGNMVSYTVNYIDEAGNTLAPSDTFYGMPGDKPAVSYKYIDGYQPNAYYQTQELKEGENIINFVYHVAESDVTTRTETNTVTDTVTVAAPGGGAGANGPAAPGTAGNPAGTRDQGGPDTSNIGDNDTPQGQTPGGNQGGNNGGNNGGNDTPTIVDNDTPKGAFDNMSPAVIAVAGAVILILIGLIAYIVGKNKKKDE